MNEPIPTRYTLRKHEAARALGISDRKLHELVKSGELPSFKMGRVVLIPVDGIQSFITAQVDTDCQQA